MRSFFHRREQERAEISQRNITNDQQPVTNILSSSYNTNGAALWLPFFYCNLLPGLSHNMGAGAAGAAAPTFFFFAWYGPVLIPGDYLPAMPAGITTIF
jgi:hypothetical protein